MTIIEQIYCSTPGINYPLHFGTAIGPTIAHVLSRYSGLCESRIEAKILLNCHSPGITSATDYTIDDLLEARSDQYDQLGINDVTFYRDDRHTQATLATIEKLIEKNIFYVVDDELYFDINSAKAKVIEQQSRNIHFFPKRVGKQFQTYLEQDEPPRCLMRNLDYGFVFGNGSRKISQVMEQVLFAACENTTKLIVSGMNVLGHYTFQAALLHTVLHDKPVYVLTHTTAKIPANSQIVLPGEKRLTLENLWQQTSEHIDFVSLNRALAFSCLNRRERSNIDKSVLLEWERLAIKWKHMKRYETIHGVSICDDESECPSNPIVDFLTTYGDNFRITFLDQLMLTSKNIANLKCIKDKRYSAKRLAQTARCIFDD